jgi:hypothetical protein
MQIIEKTPDKIVIRTPGSIIGTVILVIITLAAALFAVYSVVGDYSVCSRTTPGATSRAARTCLESHSPTVLDRGWNLLWSGGIAVVVGAVLFNSALTRYNDASIQRNQVSAKTVRYIGGDKLRDFPFTTVVEAKQQTKSAGLIYFMFYDDDTLRYMTTMTTPESAAEVRNFLGPDLVTQGSVDIIAMLVLMANAIFEGLPGRKQVIKLIRQFGSR